jgi:hypothetical protein
LYPGKSKLFIEAFQDATSVPYSYLLIDLTQSCPEKYRLRTNIFPDEQICVYVV